MKRTAIFQFSILALLSLVFMISVLLHLLEFREQRRQAEAFDAAAVYQWVNQTHLEYLHLLNGLQRLRDEDPTISEQQVRQRFEAFWKRAEAFQQTSASQPAVYPPEIRALADDLLATMASVEPNIYGMTSGDDRGFARAWPKMASLLGPLSALTEAARREEAFQAEQIRDSNRRSYWSLLASLAGLLASAAFVVFILAWERQRAREFAEAAHRSREEADWARAKLEQTFEAVPEGLALFDSDDRLMLANRRYVELYRRRRRPLRVDTPYEEILRHAMQEGAGPADERILTARLDYHEAPRGSFEMETGDGRWLLVSERRTPAGETIGMETDISRIKEREALLHRLVEENVRFATAIDAASSAIAIIDATQPGNPIIFVNPAFTSMAGYPAERCIGEGLDLIFSPEAGEAAAANLDQAIREGRDGHTEILLRRADGTTYWADFLISPIGDPNGRVTHFVTIHNDVSVRKEAERELLEAKEAAERANRSKSEFLAVLSHEVRTPLNSVLGTLAILSERSLDEDLARLVSGAHEAGRGLVAILNDILDSAKLEAGKLELEETAFDLPALLDGIASLLETRCRGKGLHFEAAIPPGLPRSVRGDPTRLRQILLNLTDNALKFTDHGWISLSATRAEEDTETGLLRIEVADTGGGMTEQQMSRLFHSFSQADASVARRYGGTGLGLAICQQLVELMGGRIGADSRISEGSRFWIEVPLPEVEALPSAVEQPAARSRSLNILMADDDPVNALVVGTMLKGSGHRFQVVENGEDAVEAARSGEFDVVLMDVSMPGMDGFEATQRIRAIDGDGSSVPILALTGYTSPADVERCLEAGMNGSLAKPIDRHALSTALASWSSLPR